MEKKIYISHYKNNFETISGMKYAEALAIMLDRISRLSPAFLSKHADKLALSLVSHDPRLVFLLNLSPKEIDALAQEFHDNFQTIMNAATLRQLKVPDNAFVMYELKDDKIEIRVEENTGKKFFGEIREGQYLGFYLIDQDYKHVKINLPYVKKVLMPDGIGYYSFILVDDHIGKEVQLLHGRIQIVPSLPTPLTINFPSYSYGKWSEGEVTNGEVRTPNGTYRLNEFLQELMWRSDVGYNADDVNMLAVSGVINGQKIMFFHRLAPMIFYECEYLPTIIKEDSSGLKLGTPALPSEDGLVLPENKIASQGIQEGFVKVIYPNKEEFLTVYTGGDLKIPKFSYPSGAFVGLQIVEGEITFTNQVEKKDFLNQVSSINTLIQKELGMEVSSQFLEDLLSSRLTAIQALSVADAVVKKLEWIKAYNGWRKRKEIIRMVIKEESKKAKHSGFNIRFR